MWNSDVSSTLLQNSFCWGLIVYHFTDITELIPSQPKAKLSEQYDADPWLKYPAFHIMKDSLGKKQENKKPKPKELLCSCWRKLGLVDFRNKWSSPSQPGSTDFHPSQISRLLPSHAPWMRWLPVPEPSQQWGWACILGTSVHTPRVHMHICASQLSRFSATPIFMGLPNIKMGCKTT